MPLFDEHPLTDLDRKAHEILGDKVVVKKLAQQAAFQGLPRYVSEYLIAKYVKPDTWKLDLANMQAKVKQLLPDLDHREMHAVVRCRRHRPGVRAGVRDRVAH